MLDFLHKFVRTAGVKNRVLRLEYMLFYPFGIDPAPPASPRMFRAEAGACHVKIEVRIDLRQLVKFVVEFNIVRCADAIKDRHSRVQLAHGRLACKATERRDT